MDEHDRIVVGSVAFGDELLAVDSVFVTTMTAQEVGVACGCEAHKAGVSSQVSCSWYLIPGAELLPRRCMEQVEASIFGPFGSTSDLTFRRANSDGSAARIYNIRAKRHIPIHVWQDWALDREGVREPDLPSAPPPSSEGRALMFSKNHRQDSFTQSSGAREIVFSDYDLPDLFYESARPQKETRQYQTEMRDAPEKAEASIPPVFRSFTSVTADDSEEIDGAISGICAEWSSQFVCDARSSRKQAWGVRTTLTVYRRSTKRGAPGT